MKIGKRYERIDDVELEELFIASRDKEICLNSSMKIGDQEQKKKMKNSHDFLEFFSDTYPNTCIELQPLLTTLVTVKSDERSFRKLKSIRFSELAIISSEIQKLNPIIFVEVANAFALAEQRIKLYKNILYLSIIRTP